MAEGLDRIVDELILSGVTDFYTGGALGFDTLAAEAVLRAREKNPHIRLIVAVPCKEQDTRWKEKDRARYHGILSHADWVETLAEQYDEGCMMRRNRFMVDRCGHCVFYLTQKRSGTYRTVAYAMEQKRKLYNIFFYQK